MTTRNLNVWWDQQLVGQLSQDRSGDIGFVYTSAWLGDENAKPLSASLPKRVEAFSRRDCRPFFGGLLPEEGQRDAVAQALGVSRANDFALLDRLGGDVAGALELLPEGLPPTVPTLTFAPRLLDDAGILNVLEALPVRPLLAGQEGLRLSLAGTQSKVPVVLVGQTIALPAPGQATTHILKPPISRFRATTENEALVMGLARAIGLDAAHVAANDVMGHAFLLIERYDRSIDASGIVRRIHQEDFCQALGIPPETKYASEGGPVLKDCFELLRRISARPAFDILKLLDAVIFNTIVGNADAHGKNFSILYDETGPRLAPLYDLLSTIAYPELSPNFAMRIGKKPTLAEIDPTAWRGFAADAGLGYPLVRRRIGELSDAIKERAVSMVNLLARPGLDQMALEHFAFTIEERAERSKETILVNG